MKKTIRKTDIFGRWGGDEFMILLPHTTIHVAQKLAERVRKKVQARFSSWQNKITCSFGVTEFKEGDDHSSFLTRADRALYESKKRGKNAVNILDRTA